jgi:hypothetical protein
MEVAPDAPAQVGKDNLKQQVISGLSEACASLGEAQASLGKATKMKAGDVTKLKTDLNGADATLKEAEADSTAEHYKDALTKVDAARVAIDSASAALRPTTKTL